MITKKSQEASASNFDHNRENSKIGRSHIYWVKDDNSSFKTFEWLKTAHNLFQVCAVWQGNFNTYVALEQMGSITYNIGD